MASLQIAKVAGIDPNYVSIPKSTSNGYVVKPVVWNARVFDTVGIAFSYPSDPSKPNYNGLFYLSGTGYYRFVAQIYYSPWDKASVKCCEIYDTPNGASVYLTLNALGNLDTGQGWTGQIAVANTQPLFGRHPSTLLDTVVRNDLPGSYYQFNTYWLPVPAQLNWPNSHTLEAEAKYNFAYIERIGDL